MNRIYFTVNGRQCSPSSSELGLTLNEYLRNTMQLHGTKSMCHEGGCGACAVSVSMTHPVTKERLTVGVNSCLVNIFSCHGWDITTIEGIGNRRDGYHDIQRRLASFNGSQCGYCSPGMVMSMYSLTKSNKKLSSEQIENAFGSNICRCTGYRPILDAFKSFATNAGTEIKDKLEDVEDLHKLKCLKSKLSLSDDDEDDWCVIGNDETTLKEMTVNGSRWYKAYNVRDVFQILNQNRNSSYRIIAGNTGQGVYPISLQPNILIDITPIQSLKRIILDENLIIGAGITLTELSVVFKKMATNSDFSYLAQFNEHLDMVAHILVKNIGTIGGNLTLKHMHNIFPSDIYVLLATVGSIVTLLNSNLSTTQLTMESFLSTDINYRIILNVKLPPLSPSNRIRTYKVMSRAQNTHAIVNAGFLYKIDDNGLIQYTNIVFGNISPNFTTANKTVGFLKGKSLFDEDTVQMALKILDSELVPVILLPEPSPKCRKDIAVGLFYKSILSLSPSLNSRYKSGGTGVERGLSHGTQVFDSDESLWPVNEPVLKLEGLSQCSGEVKYSCDITTPPQAVQVAFVISEICKGDILGFDAKEALNQPGVIAFFTAADIPGKNSFTPKGVSHKVEEEEILATKVLYYGQPIAIIVANTHKIALTAAKLVKVRYNKSKAKPVMNIRDALKANDKDKRVRQDCDIKPTDKGSDVVHTIKGSFTVPSQYHFHMETQSCTVSNTSRGIRVRASTQWMDLLQMAVADALKIDHNRVEVIVPRVGGAYGAKLTRASQVACACAIVAHKLNTTASMVLPLEHNMVAIGKRQLCEADYELGVNSEGLIQYMHLITYTDVGCSFNESKGDLSNYFKKIQYDKSRWNIKGHSVITDKASNTACRGPGGTESIAIIEHIMERIAHEVNKDATDIRIMHLGEKDKVMKEIVESFKKDCDFDQRKAEINRFNDENAWKKKALQLSWMAYPIVLVFNFPVTISIYHGDGTITISHAGVEMGQGINTKVAQVCAYALKVPLEKVTVKGCDTFTSPNSGPSGGSMASDSVAYATLKACEEMLDRLKPLRKELNNPTWEKLVAAANNKGIQLQVSHMTSPLDSLESYSVYGVCATEVELDVLTGNHVVRRVDLMEDTGISISPEIDVGQIEGAFVMGLGLWTSENLVYDMTTGELLTARTWSYKPPGAMDIPVDFRISFRRNAPNSVGVLGSKSTGEPALTLVVSVAFALHDAITAARKEFGYKDTDWIHVDTPYTVENILKAISPKYECYKLK